MHNYCGINPLLTDVLDSVITVVFQITFHSKIYVNNFFYFLKIIFDIRTSKLFENIKKILI